MRRCNGGWKFESARHSLAAKHVKTGRKHKSYSLFVKGTDVKNGKFECEFCDRIFSASYPEPSHTFEPICPKCKRSKDVIEIEAAAKSLGAKGKSYTYRIVDIENPKGLTLNQTEMVRYAKKMLSASKRQGYDKEVMSSDISEPVNAWVYLKNIGLGESTDRTVWAKGKRPVFIKEPFGLPRELQPTGMYRKKWKSVHDAPVKEIQQDFKRMYGRKPTSHEMQDILLEGEW